MDVWDNSTAIPILIGIWIDRTSNLKLCAKGAWNENMCVETALSMVTFVCELKSIRVRLTDYVQARLAFVSAMFNVPRNLFHLLLSYTCQFKMSIAEFSL